MAPEMVTVDSGLFFCEWTYIESVALVGGAIRVCSIPIRRRRSLHRSVRVVVRFGRGHLNADNALTPRPGKRNGASTCSI